VNCWKSNSIKKSKKTIMANKKYTETDVKLWAKFYLEGWTLQDVADFCKVPRSSVRKLLEPLNI
jgi:hypothetical protein